MVFNLSMFIIFILFFILFKIRQRGPSVDQALADMSKKMKVLTAAKILLHILHEKNINSDAKINKNEFKEAFGQVSGKSGSVRSLIYFFMV